MSMIIGISIDLNKVKKELIKAGKNGAKYYDMTVLVNDKPDKYGQNVAVIDRQSKEQREAKEARNYLGNGKVVYGSLPTSAEASQERLEVNSNESIDDLPF